ncbi:MAG TPA: polymer-forming cytoskeletal protein [Firmicutes bacterium]|jgi:cytoskeletal protein CcmA (bactofilin family)|nr:polymer-forming cytoskeletal protein [Bacillota bacterium]
MRKNAPEISNRVGNKKIDTLIGKDSAFTGNIESTGTIRIDGKFEGEIITKGDLVIGESGQVQGKIKAENITIAGKVQGEVEASGKLELVPTGNLQGEAKMTLLVVEEGAVFQGNCQQFSKDRKERGKFLQIETPPEKTGQMNAGKK